MQFTRPYKLYVRNMQPLIQRDGYHDVKNTSIQDGTRVVEIESDALKGKEIYLIIDDEGKADLRQIESVQNDKHKAVFKDLPHCKPYWELVYEEDVPPEEKRKKFSKKKNVKMFVALHASIFSPGTTFKIYKLENLPGIKDLSEDEWKIYGNTFHPYMIRRSSGILEIGKDAEIMEIQEGTLLDPEHLGLVILAIRGALVGLNQALKGDQKLEVICV